MADAQQATRIRATARREGGAFRHSVRIRGHQLTVDEPPAAGGGDAGPHPRELLAASLASCTAITMEMYAARKGWQVGAIEVDVEYTSADRHSTTEFELVLRIPDDVPREQAERLAVIAAKCPVHRVLEGKVSFEERVERVHLAA